ncbi:MAG: VanZ family protein [Clostridia bacterium]|nr:VanZ family protein [Clostridia bacterium]
MKRKSKNWLSADVFILLASALLLVGFFLSELKLDLLSPPVGTVQFWRCILLFMICLIAYLGGVLFQRRTKKSIVPYLFYAFLFLYLYLILSLTLMDKGLRLDSNRLMAQGVSPREYYLKWFVNFQPLQSIYTVYIRGLLDGYVSIRYTVLNLLGNLCAFMPLSVLLPACLKCMRRWYWFLISVFLFVLFVEGMQFWLMVGSCDIDDVILNVGGAILLYLFFLIPPIRRWMERFWSGDI